MNRKVYRRIHNNEFSETLYKRKNGDIVASDGYYIANIKDKDCEDKVEDFVEGWFETHWSVKDWANWYGCEEEEVEYIMDSDSYWTE